MMKLLLCLLLLCSSSFGAVTFSNGEGANHNSTISSFNADEGAGSLAFMLVGIVWESNGGGGVGDASGVDYGTAAMTFEGKLNNGTAGGVEIWSLDDAGMGSQGAVDVVVSWTNQPQNGQTCIFVAVFDGVDQTTPEFDTTFVSMGNDTNFTTTVSTTTGGMTFSTYQHGTPGINWVPLNGETEWTNSDQQASSMRGGAMYNAGVNFGTPNSGGSPDKWQGQVIPIMVQ